MSKAILILLVLFSTLSVQAQSFSHEDSVRIHGQKILDNKIQPSDDDLTFACLANLYADNATDRAFYFKVYVVMARKSDAALSEGICGYIKTYLELYPAEAIEDFNHLSKADQDRFIEYVAFEFYASGEDYKADIDDYFNSIASRCNTCNIDNPTVLYLKRTLLDKAKSMVESDL